MRRHNGHSVNKEKFVVYKWALKDRKSFYDNIPVFENENSEDNDVVDEQPHCTATSTPAASPVDEDWKKFIFIKGKPGTGKSHAINTCIKNALDRNATVCVQKLISS